MGQPSDPWGPPTASEIAAASADPFGPPTADELAKAGRPLSASTGPIVIPKSSLSADPFGPPTADELAKAGRPLSASTGPIVIPKSSLPGPSPLFVAPPQPDAPSVLKAVADRDNRDAASARSLTHGGLMSKYRNDAVYQSKFGENPDTGPQAAKLATDYSNAQQQMAGTAPESDMPATAGSGDKEHLNFSSFLQRYGVAGLRPVGVAVSDFADKVHRKIEFENPGLTDDQINKKFWHDWYRMPALSNPGMALSSLREGLDPGKLLDANQPTIIDAPGQIIRKYGENKQSAPSALTNFGTALTDAPGAILKAATIAEHLKAQARGDEPQQNVPSLSDALTTVGPDSMPASGPTAPGPLGTRITPQAGNLMGFGAASAVDALPLAAKGVKALGGAAGTIARAVAESPQFLPATTAASDALSRGISAVRRIPAVDTIGSALQGADWDARQGVLQYDALRKSQPALNLPDSPVGAAQTARAAIRQIPGKQTLELRDLAKQADVMNVDPSKWSDFSNAIEDPARRTASLAKLTPEEQLAVATYENRSLTEKARQGAVMPVKTRENYMAGMPTESVAAKVPLKVEAAGRRAAGTEFEEQVATPQKIKYNAKRTLTQNLSDESGRPIITRADVEDYFQNGMKNPGTSPIVDYLAKDWDLKPGDPVWEMDPKKNFVRRFTPGTMQTVQAEAYSKLKPLAVDSENVLPGMTATPQGSILKGTTGQQIPAAWQRMVLRQEGEGAPGLAGNLYNKVTQPWKEAVTTMASPAYHMRNKLFSMLKRGGEFEPDELLHQEQGFNALKSGQPGTFAGIPLKDIGDYAASEGTWAGTGAGPYSEISNLNKSAGVNQPTTMAGKAYAAIRTPDRAVRGAAGAVANATDEGERIRAFLGQLERNQGLGSAEKRLADARDFSFKAIVSTGDKSPSAKAVSQVLPFITWNVRESPNTAMSYAQGKMPLAPRFAQLMNANADQENKVPEKFRGERSTEGQGFPLNKRGEKGMPLYMNLPGSPVQVMTSLGDPVYEAFQALRGKSSIGDVGKKFVDTVGQNAMPGLSLGMAAMSGTSPLTHTDIGSVQKAPAQEQVLANLSPKLAKEVGMVQSEDGTWYGTGLQSMISNMMPWSPAFRLAASKTGQEKERAIGSMFGATASEIDPSQEHYKRRLEIEQQADKVRKMLVGPGGLPARFVYKKH